MDEVISQPSERSVHEPILEDLPSLRKIMEMSIIDAESGLPIQDEINETINLVTRFINGDPTIYYLVAYDESSKPVGMLGVKKPDEKMKEFARRPEECVELVNAFNDPSVRGMGYGKLLVNSTLEWAELQGATEVVVNSGPRYKNTGWGFWDRMFVLSDRQVLPDRYGPNLHAMVWRGDIPLPTTLEN